MTGHGNGSKIGSEQNLFCAFKQTLGLGRGLRVGSMDDPGRPEVLGIALRVGYVVFVRQKNVREAASALEGLDQMLEVTR